jgi:hypothetical protein
MIKFHGVYVDPLAVIGVGEVMFVITNFCINIHLPGSVMTVTVLPVKDVNDDANWEYQLQLAQREQEKLIAEIEECKEKYRADGIYPLSPYRPKR